MYLKMKNLYLYIVLLCFYNVNITAKVAEETNGDEETIVIEEVEVISACALNVSWKSTVSNTTSFTIKWSTQSGTKGEDTAKGDQESYVIKGLDAKTTYKVTVIANPSKKKSDEKPGTTKDPAPPLKPNITEITDTRIYMTWEDPKDDCKIDMYSLKWTGKVLWKESKTVSGSDTTEDVEYVLTNLVPYSEYDISITSNANGKSSSAEKLKATTQETLPKEPEKLNATPKVNTSIDVTWSEPLEVNGKIDHFKIFWKSPENKSWNKQNCDNFYYTITELLGCEYYDIQIQAVNGAGEGDFSNTTAVTLKEAPPKVKNLKATSESSKSVRLSWDPPLTNCSLSSYTSKGTGNQLWGNKKVMQVAETDFPASEKEHVISDLLPYTEYEFCLRASVSEELIGEWTCTKVKTLQDVPSEPTNLTIRGLTKNSIDIEWCDPEVANGLIKQFKVKWSQDDQEYRLVTHDDRNTSYRISLTGMRSNTDYQIRVQAESAAGYGAPAKKLATTNLNVLGIVLGVMIPMIIIGIAIGFAIINRDKLTCFKNPLRRTLVN